MRNSDTTDAQLWAAWTNMLLCSEAIASASSTAEMAGCDPVVSSLKVAMNLATTELDEIATELGNRGLKMRTTCSPGCSPKVAETIARFNRI